MVTQSGLRSHLALLLHDYPLVTQSGPRSHLALMQCSLSAAGGSVAEVSITNFPYAQQSDVSARYGAKTATVTSLSQTSTSTASQTIIQLRFDSAIEPGIHRVEISPWSQSSTRVYIDIVFEAAIAVTQVRFQTHTAGTVEIKFNYPIGVSERFACSSVIVDAPTLFGTDSCSLNTRRNAIIARMAHVRGITAIVGTTVTFVEGSIQPLSLLSSLAAQTL